METDDYLPFEPMPTSIKECQKQVSVILRGMPRGRPVDSPLLRWLARWSPKIGPQIEIDYFTIEDNWNHGYVTIAHLPDGTAIDFTYRHPVADFYRYNKTGLVESRAAHYERRLKKAMRFAITDQIAAWRGAHGGHKGVVVDHAWPRTFDVLCDRFRLVLAAQDRYGDAWERFIGEDVSLEAAYIWLTDGGPENRYMNVITSRAVLAQWLAFHADHARLRWIPSITNSVIADRDPRLHGYNDLGAGTPVP
ncbi:hypothetical protein HF289_10600 [Acidithiobacillus ferrooxidans]|uniref:hypothetical protein n=1 Tax=Acidithiobacillus ferrooxidans TaxID=920 RepID=UPI001C074AF6|nr:hypothetical protein [Acidithiobacillus ferrooxidans]MBU2857294.1 hypothetical protein [Acidithiobacillus ferrooxidans]